MGLITNKKIEVQKLRKRVVNNQEDKNVSLNRFSTTYGPEP